MLFAQAETQVIAAVATTMVTLGGLVVWLVRSWMGQAAAREAVLSARITEVEKFNREQLQNLVVSCRDSVEKNTAIVTKLIASIESHPCFWSPEKQAEILHTYFKQQPKEGTTQP